MESLFKKHNIVVLEAVAASSDTARKEKRTVHAVGDGTFIVAGRKIDRRKMMPSKLPCGVWRPVASHEESGEANLRLTSGGLLGDGHGSAAPRIFALSTAALAPAQRARSRTAGLATTSDGMGAAVSDGGADAPRLLKSSL